VSVVCSVALQVSSQGSACGYNNAGNGSDSKTYKSSDSSSSSSNVPSQSLRRQQSSACTAEATVKMRRNSDKQDVDKTLKAVRKM
jgi:hypothetical protein